MSAFLQINAQDFEISPVDLKFDAEPGQSQSKSITITNHSNKNSTFVVSIADFAVDKYGRKIAVEQSSTDHSLANWLSINPVFLTISPNETRQVIVSVQAPVEDYSSRWSYIFIKNTVEQTAFNADKNLKSGMNISGQIAVEVYQSPESNKNYKMKIYELSEIVSENDSIRQFTAIADNIGEKITNCKVTLLASNLSNAEETVLQVIRFKSFADTQREIKFTIKSNALKPGKYALAAILDYGIQSNLEGTQMIINVK